MRNASGGYTLIEVMLFLAISGIILAISVVVVRGQSAHTEFITSMNDVNTKMQQWIDEVDNGFTNSTSSSSSVSDNYNCTLDGSGYPKLTAAVGSGNERGANPDCVFLGRAIQVTDSADTDHNNHIYAYTVLGRRTYINAGQTIGVDSIVNANPVAAIAGADLTEDYLVPGGVRVLSVNSSGGVGTHSHMAGFFTSFNTPTSAQHNGASSLLSMLYPLSGNRNPKSDDVQNCIKLKSPCQYTTPVVSNPWPMSNWKVCFGSTRNDEWANLTVISSGGFGAKTELTFHKGGTKCVG